MDGVAFCNDCPLRNGDFPSNYCRYFDLSAPKDRWREMNPTPEMEKERIDNLMAAGISSEFPEYVEEDGSADELLIEKAIRFAALRRLVVSVFTLTGKASMFVFNPFSMPQSPFLQR